MPDGLDGYTIALARAHLFRELIIASAVARDRPTTIPRTFSTNLPAFASAVETATHGILHRNGDPPCNSCSRVF